MQRRGRVGVGAVKAREGAGGSGGGDGIGGECALGPRLAGPTGPREEKERAQR